MKKLLSLVICGLLVVACGCTDADNASGKGAVEKATEVGNAAVEKTGEGLEAAGDAMKKAGESLQGEGGGE